MRITSSLRQLSSITPRFNETITEDGKEKLQVLLKNGWNLSKNGIGIEKAYEFRGFSRAMKFIRFVADEAKDKKHHPEWANVYSKVHIRWTTHNPPGLGINDIAMAESCDKYAMESGLKVTTRNDASTVLEEHFPVGTECKPCLMADKSPKEEAS